jgi:hypothetical protein
MLLMILLTGANCLERLGPEHVPGGTLDVVQFIRGSYVKGSVSYLDIRPGPEHFRDRALDGRDTWGCPSDRSCYHVDIGLVPGRYVITSWQRPCLGGCGWLGSAGDRCSEPLILRDQDYVSATITVTPGHGCTISFVR